MRRSWYKIISNFVVLLVLAALLYSLTGCSAGGGDSEYGAAHSYEYDQYDPVTGITLKANTGDDYSFLTFEQMVAEYVDLEQCMADTSTPGPTITFTSFNDYGFQLEIALYYYAIQTVFIDTDHEPWLPIRNHISDREWLRHEYGHHVLYLNGLDDSHANPLFEQCSALGPKTCNGEYCD